MLTVNPAIALVFEPIQWVLVWCAVPSWANATADDTSERSIGSGSAGDGTIHAEHVVQRNV